MNLSPLPIRLFCDLVAPGALNDLNRNSQPPSFYRGDDIEIDIGLGQAGALLTSLANVASVTCQVFLSENDTTAPQMACTVLAASMNLTLTGPQWTAASAAPHAAFVFPNAQTAISLGGQASANFWLRVTVATTDSPAKIITALDGPITVRDGPISTASVPPSPGFRMFTVAGIPVPQLYDATAAGWRTLAIYNDSGVPTLQLSDTLY